jgi:hypothetical protein
VFTQEVIGCINSAAQRVSDAISLNVAAGPLPIAQERHPLQMDYQGRTTVLLNRSLKHIHQLNRIADAGSSP